MQPRLALMKVGASRKAASRVRPADYGFETPCQRLSEPEAKGRGKRERID